MKLLNTVDASKVIGGTAPVCETSFDTVTVGAGTDNLPTDHKMY
ncbi:DUF4762 family protein [Providencia rettgeri]|nr:DUF4762 family protein [Providencia rettgeri]